MADLSKIKLNGTTYNLKDAAVPSWAKAENKPTYTANEIQGILSAIYLEQPKILEPGPYANISLTLGSSYSIKDQRNGTIQNFTMPSVPSWALESTKPTYTANEVGALSSSTTYVSSFNGNTGAITYSAPISSVNGDTGAIIVDQLKTTSSSNNTEYNLIGTATSNTNTAAVDIYKQDLLSFAKTTSLGRLTIGSTSIPGVVRIYTSVDSANGFTDIKSNASSTNERTITLPDASGTVALTTDIPSVPSWAMASSKPSYTFSELTSHPTTLNDYGITDAYTKTEVDGLVSGVLHYKGTKTTTSALPSSGNITGDVWHITADGSEWAWDGSAWQELGTAVDLSGYLQSSDIAAWAKAANKPSYTASEVGALASNTAYVSTFNGQSGAITYTPPVSSVNGQTGVVELTIPADTSELTNGAGFLTSFTETDPTVPSWAKASTKPSYTASEVGAMATTHAANSITSSDISNWNGKTNNTGTVTSVRVQATSPVQSSTSTAQSTTLNTTISLASGYGDTQNPYASKTAKYVLAAPNASNGVPTFRALVASDLPAIGNITNGGDITANATIASGDRLIINDESASKVINSSITFGSSTKQYLANNGTWQNAYDDTALAARVTALEQLEWATYYSGRSNPSNSQGQNGDIYLQY